MDKTASSTVLKAMHVLDSLLALSQNENRQEGVSVTELARHSGEHASSVCKHLAAFQHYRLVEQNPRTGRYTIGMFALQLASVANRHIDLRNVAAKHLQELVDTCGETVHLVIRDGLQVVYIAKVEPPKAIRMHSELGARNPLYCTGVGKAYLAFSAPSLVEEVLQEGLKKFTGHTLITRSQLEHDLQIIRQRGYALDLEEHEEDVHCAAAPIFNHLGEIAGAISISGPKWRLTTEQLPAFGQLVVQTASGISEKLGFTHRQHIPSS